MLGAGESGKSTIIKQMRYRIVIVWLSYKQARKNNEFEWKWFKCERVNFKLVVFLPCLFTAALCLSKSSWLESTVIAWLPYPIFYLRIIHANGYTNEECEKYKTVIYTNATSSIITIIRSMSSLNIQFQNKDNNVSSWALDFEFRAAETPTNIYRI